MTYFYRVDPTNCDLSKLSECKKWLGYYLAIIRLVNYILGNILAKGFAINGDFLPLPIMPLTNDGLHLLFRDHSKSSGFLSLFVLQKGLQKKFSKQCVTV